MKLSFFLKKVCRITVLLILLSLAPAGIGITAHAQENPAGRGMQSFDLVTTGQGWLLLDDRLYWSSDDGATWSDITPAEGVTTSVTFFDSARGYALLGSDDGYHLASTSDGGVTWETGLLDLPGLADAVAPVRSASMGWSSLTDGWLVFKLASGSNFSLGQLYTTDDGGQTWQQRSAPLGEPAYFTGQHGWMAGGPAGDQLFQTDDGGTTWQPLDFPGLPGLPSFSDELHGTLPVIVTEGTASLNLYQTEDAGQTWTLAGSAPIGADLPEGTILPLVPTDAGNFIFSVPGSARILKTDGALIDASNNVDGVSAGITAVAMADAQSGWASWSNGECASQGEGTLSCTSETRFLRTSDGGLHWEVVTVPGDGQQSSFLLPDKSLSSGGMQAQAASAPVAYIGQGFDKCEIPNLTNMQKWWTGSPYNAVNLYIGGSSRGCSNAALTEMFVAQLAAQGWQFIPTWVGPQASCSTWYDSTMSSDPIDAYDEGVAEADLALQTAIDLGLASPDGSGAIIYYDLEAYNTGDSNCRAAANSFISGWTARMQTRGSLAGVYGASCGSVPADWASLPNVPDALWVANWYDVAGAVSYFETASVYGAACLPDSLWSSHQRLRQYAGDHQETWGNLTLTIDSNVIDGPVAEVDVTSEYPPAAPILLRPLEGKTFERTEPIWLGWKTTGTICSVHLWGGAVNNIQASECGIYYLGTRKGGAYSWQVTTTNNAGTTVGPVWHFNVKPHVPISPSATTVSSSKVNISWGLSYDDPSNVDGYNVYADGILAGTAKVSVKSLQVEGLSCNETHSFWVKTVRQGVESNPTVTVTATTPSCAPSLLSPEEGVTLITRRPAFSWQAVEGVSKYQIQVSTVSSYSSMALNLVVTSNSLTPATDLAAGTLYYWRVRSFMAMGLSDWTESQTFKTADAPPSVPALSTPARNALMTVQLPLLDWANSVLPSGVEFDHYQVQVATNSTFTSLHSDVIVDGLENSSYLLEIPVLPNVMYYWRVRAFNSDGNASAWTSYSYFRSAILPPNITSPGDGENLPQRRPYLDWSDVDNAKSYTFQVSPAANFSPLTYTTSVVSSAFQLPKDLPASTFFYWRVRTNGSLGPSQWSTVGTFKTGNPPSIPSLYSPGNKVLLTSYTPVLNWWDSSIPEGTTFSHYQIQIATDNLFATVVLEATSPISEFVPAVPLPDNTRYYWHVRAFNTDGHFSNWSAARYFRSAMLPPQLASLAAGENVPNRRPLLDWNDVGGASSYSIQYSLTSAFTKLLITASSSQSGYQTAKDLPANSLVYWRVRANGTNGPSLWSVVGSFKTGNPPSAATPVLPAKNALTAQPKLDWSDVSVPVGTTFDYYQIQISRDVTFSSVDIEDKATVSNYSPSVVLVGNSRYYWRVRAYNTDGHYGAWSLTYYFRTPIDMPTLLAPAHQNVQAIVRPVFDWEDTPGAASYLVQVSLDENFSSYLVSTTTYTSYFTPTINLPAGVTVYWRVRANGANGPSLWSEVHSFVIELGI